MAMLSIPPAYSSDGTSAALGHKWAPFGVGTPEQHTTFCAERMQGFTLCKDLLIFGLAKVIFDTSFY